MGQVEFQLQIKDLETKYNLPSGFISSLQKENDWSFVIKIYAIFEALLSELITKTSMKPELIDFFLKLDMCSKPIGKLELLRSLKLLEESERKFIRALADLRNTYAHNIKKVSVPIGDIIDSYLPDKQKNIIQGLTSNLKKKEDFKSNIRQCIWAASVMLLCQINERLIRDD